MIEQLNKHNNAEQCKNIVYIISQVTPTTSFFEISIT